MRISTLSHQNHLRQTSRYLAGCSKSPAFSPTRPELQSSSFPMGYVEDAFERRTPLADVFSTLLGLALEQVRKMGKGCEG